MCLSDQIYWIWLLVNDFHSCCKGTSFSGFLFFSRRDTVNVLGFVLKFLFL